MRRLTLVLLILAGLLAFVGCGTDAKDEYADQVVNVLQPLSDDLQQFGEDATGATSLKEISAALSGSEDALGSALEDFREIDPPDDVTEINDDLVAEIEDYRTLVANTAEAVDGGDPKVFNAALKMFLPESRQFVDELDSIRQRAIDAGVPFEDTDSESE